MKNLSSAYHNKEREKKHTNKTRSRKIEELKSRRKLKSSVEETVVERERERERERGWVVGSLFT